MDSISDTNLLRIGIAIAALVLIAIILFTSRKKPAQGIKTIAKDSAEAPRLEPTLKNMIESEVEDAANGDVNQVEQASQGQLDIGNRQTPEFDKIVSILIAARSGQA
jgi:cell division protein ZipA